MLPRSRAEVIVSPIPWHVVFRNFECCSRIRTGSVCCSCAAFLSVTCVTHVYFATFGSRNKSFPHHQHLHMVAERSLWSKSIQKFPNQHTMEEAQAAFQQLHNRLASIEEAVHGASDGGAIGVVTRLNLIEQLISAGGATGADRNVRRSHLACSKGCSDTPIFGGEYEEYEDWRVSTLHQVLHVPRRLGPRSR